MHLKNNIIKYNNSWKTCSSEWIECQGDCFKENERFFIIYFLSGREGGIENKIFRDMKREVSEMFY